MKLTELDPRWLIKDDKRVGFTFRSPTDPKWRQSCFVQPTPMRDQMALFEAMHGDEGIQPCKQSIAWTIEDEIENANFDTMTVSPSLDGSAGGLWHGHITKGQIVGGL
jgi:hypothetical protein